MRSTKLSARAWEILLVIDERSEPDPDGRYWTPALYRAGRGCDDWCDKLERFVNINGAGDARIIESLRAKELIAQHHCRTANVNHYASRITEKGRILIEEGLEKGLIPLRNKNGPLKYDESGHLS